MGAHAPRILEAYFGWRHTLAPSYGAGTGEIHLVPSDRPLFLSRPAATASLLLPAMTLGPEPHQPRLYPTAPLNPVPAHPALQLLQPWVDRRGGRVSLTSAADGQGLCTPAGGWAANGDVGGRPGTLCTCLHACVRAHFGWVGGPWTPGGSLGTGSGEVGWVSSGVRVSSTPSGWG